MKKSLCLAILLSLLVPCFAEKASLYIGSESMISDPIFMIIGFTDASPESFAVSANFSLKIDYHCLSLVIGTDLGYSKQDTYTPQIGVGFSLQPEVYFVTIKKIAKYGIAGYVKVYESINLSGEQSFVPAIIFGPYITNTVNLTDRIQIKNDLGAVIVGQGTGVGMGPLLRSGILFKLND